MKFLKDARGQIDTMNLVIGISSVIGLVVFVMLVAPVIEDKIGNTVDIPAGSNWNATENSDIPTGADVRNYIGLLLLLVLAISGIATYVYLFK